ncbi:MAG: hypothetical protein V7756_14335 [Halopseudomonas sp.]|uniref:hypothetical protein n=1 Tax=Halopseudomonas sp. TaxID=2901191 RepID=UPI00300335CF
MQYLVLAVLVGCVALLLAVLALRFGWRLRWLLGWLKGNVLLALLAAAVMLGLAAWDLQNFTEIEPRAATVGTLSFNKVGNQQYEAVLTGPQGNETVRIAGDLWELEVEVLRWHGLPGALGLVDGYRLHRLLGRYLALEQQHDSSANGRELLPNLHSTPPWRDLWAWIDNIEAHRLLEADAFEVRFIPLTDGAQFSLELGPTGLTPVPLNPAATAAMKRFN